MAGALLVPQDLILCFVPCVGGGAPTVKKNIRKDGGESAEDFRGCLRRPCRIRRNAAFSRPRSSRACKPTANSEPGAAGTPPSFPIHASDEFNHAPTSRNTVLENRCFPMGLPFADRLPTNNASIEYFNLPWACVPVQKNHCEFRL